jgi:hypothetical protein
MMQFHTATADRCSIWRFISLTFTPRALAVGLCAILGLPSLASASIIASDDFNADPIGNLNGATGGTGWAAAWVATDGVAPANVADYSGDRKVNVTLTGTTTSVSASRRTSPIAQTFYATFTIRHTPSGTGTWGGNNTFGLILSDLTTPNATVATNVLNFGLRPVGGNQFCVRGGTGTPVATNSAGGLVVANTDYKLVAKMIYTSGRFDRIDLWINPTSLVEPASSDAACSLVAGTGVTAVNSVYFRQAANETDDAWRLDKLMLATAWSDVVPPATPPPSITLQPRSQTNCVGTATVFTSAATGTPTPTVQWQVSTNAGGAWANVGGAVSTSYSPATVMGNNGNLYRAVFSNAGGSTNSSAAKLTVNSGPTAVNYSINATPNQPRVIDIAVLLAACTALEGNAFYLSAVAPLSTNGAPVAITATNTVVYQPQAGFTGADRFNYTITDLLGCSATAAVQMTVGP